MAHEVSSRVSTRVRPGDVLEFETPAGLAYLQITHRDPVRQELVRVLPGTYPERPRDVAGLVGGPERFLAFYPADLAARQHLAQVVAKFPIPGHAQGFPAMLLEGMDDRDGRILTWWLYDGKRERPLDEQALKGYRHLPVVRGLLHQGLINAVVSEGRADEFREFSDVARPSSGAATGPASTSQPREIVAFLEAPSQSAARAAADEAAAAGYETAVKPAEAPGDWQVIASAPMRTDLKLEDVDGFFEAVAGRVSGRYDGHEVRFGSAAKGTTGS